MRAFSSILLALSLAATSCAGGVPEGIAPSEPSPEGCEKTVDGNFTIGILYVPVKGKRATFEEEAIDGAFACTLNDGILHDPYNRTGAIVANRQFQFDGPPQAGSIYTGGWAVCKNNSLALGPSTIFWRCTSGGFMNLYDENVADQCIEATIQVQFASQPSSSSSSSTASSTRTSSSIASSSVSSSASLIPITAINGTQTTSVPSLNGTTFSSASITPSATATDSSGSAASSTGAAAPSRVPRKETFGAVIGILGAALML
ncbi:hypothetical protein BDV96DRAFT_145376 [Lophiotrema nucula]|uniref:Cell wall mannoprotein PIR1-like C-terminal domain-containing protein n=1 Tax=Lophiotrema nucula TaxID=690887 RepID=A0A6A5Z0D8_9PLEO|nr:hypothetical protein BDV96DRAFT_145376 [Lophiotrema nucula]